MITILAGGTGSVKLVRGLATQRTDVNVVCNVGDNYWLYGMYVCPDIDTITYGLAELLDADRGWGIKKDTFGFLRQMEIFWFTRLVFGHPPPIFGGVPQSRPKLT